MYIYAASFEVILFLDSNGILQRGELLFCKHGVLHGYHLSWGNQVKILGLYINGRKCGTHWHAFPGGSFLCRGNVDSSNEGAFIYSDLETVLQGTFEDDGALIQAVEATLTGKMKKILLLSFLVDKRTKTRRKFGFLDKGGKIWQKAEKNSDKMVAKYWQNSCQIRAKSGKIKEK